MTNYFEHSEVWMDFTNSIKKEAGIMDTLGEVALFAGGEMALSALLGKIGLGAGAGAAVGTAGVAAAAWPVALGLVLVGGVGALVYHMNNLTGDINELIYRMDDLDYEGTEVEGQIEGWKNLLGQISGAFKEARKLSGMNPTDALGGLDRIVKVYDAGLENLKAIQDQWFDGGVRDIVLNKEKGSVLDLGFISSNLGLGDVSDFDGALKKVISKYEASRANMEARFSRELKKATQPVQKIYSDIKSLEKQITELYAAPVYNGVEKRILQSAEGYLKTGKMLPEEVEAMQLTLNKLRDGLQKLLPKAKEMAAKKQETTAAQEASLTKTAGKYDHIDFKPPKSVADAAARGLDLRKKNKGKGGLNTQQAKREGVGSGVQRAVNLKNRNTLSPSTVRRMKAFFDRHRKNKGASGGKPLSQDKGYIAWLIWGGDPGYSWAKKIVRQMDAADKKASLDLPISKKAVTLPGLEPDKPKAGPGARKPKGPSLPKLDNVADMQRQINDMSVAFDFSLPGGRLQVDGKYGPKTAQAVVAVLEQFEKVDPKKYPEQASAIQNLKSKGVNKALILDTKEMNSYNGYLNQLSNYIDNIWKIHTGIKKRETEGAPISTKPTQAPKPGEIRQPGDKIKPNDGSQYSSSYAVCNPHLPNPKAQDILACFKALPDANPTEVGQGASKVGMHEWARKIGLTDMEIIDKMRDLFNGWKPINWDHNRIKKWLYEESKRRV